MSIFNINSSSAPYSAVIAFLHHHEHPRYQTSAEICAEHPALPGAGLLILMLHQSLQHRDGSIQPSGLEQLKINETFQ